jgi:hypothetical protein
MKKTILIPLFFCFAQILFSQTSKTVEINAGGLSSSLTDTERTSVTHLTVTGFMNSNDFSFIRNSMPEVTHLYLSGVEISDKKVPGSAFENKKTLQYVALPLKATHINDWAFYQCSSMREVVLPDSLQHIGYHSFAQCISLQSVPAFPQSLTNFEAYAFYNCYSMRGSMALPPKITVLKTSIFQHCSALTGVTLPDSLRTIDGNAFYGCSSFKGELIIPAKVTSIAGNAFNDNWFNTCIVRAAVPPAINVSSPSLGRLKVFYVPSDSKAAYRADGNWSRYVIVGGENMVAVTVNLETPGTLGDMVLQHVSYLKDVNKLTISGQMNSVDMDLLKNNFPDLLELDFAKTNITDIPNNHFYDKANLAIAILPDSLVTLGERAFFRCYNLQKVVVPKKVKDIRTYTFYDNYYLKDLTLPAGLTTIGNYAFQYCHSLETLVLPDSLTTLSYQAFYNCSRLRSVTIKNKVTSIPNDLFSECDRLEEVILPNTITSIGNYAFYDCFSLRRMKLPDNLRSIGYQSFYNCAFDSIVFPPGLHSYDNYAFNNCTKLRYVRCNQPTPPPLSFEIFNNLDKKLCVLEVPFWSETMYKQANVWSYFTTITAFTTEMKDIPVNGTLTLNNNVRPPGFPNVTVMSTGSLTVGGNAPFVTDKFEVFSRLNGNAWGSLINNCPAMSANTVKASFDVNSNKWYFLSFPYDVRVSDIKAMSNGLFVVRYYDGATRALNGASGNWKNMTNDSTLKAGKGYIMSSNINTRIEVPATEETRNNLFNYESRTVALQQFSSQTNANKNWNFVGNPFPSYYDSRYIECTAPITVWNLSNNTYQAYSLVDDKYALKPFEGFFVQKPDDLTQMTFLAGGRLPSATVPDQGPSGVPAKSKVFGQTNRLLINLELTGNEQTDRSRIVLNEQALATYETTCDAAKFMSSEPTVPQVYSFDADGVACAINERPLLGGLIPLGFYAGMSGDYSLRIPSMAENADLSIVLIDKALNRETDLLNSDYHFNASAGTYNERFVLRIAKVISGNQETDPTRNYVALSNGRLLIHTQAGTAITVYNVQGMQITRLTAETTNTYLALPKGAYLVQIGEEIFKSVVF